MALEDRFIYRPTRVGHVVKQGTDVGLTTQDGVKLHAIYSLRAYAYFTFLFLHGSTGGLPRHRGVLTFLTRAGANVFAVEYRGYGRSQGEPSEAGLYADALAAYDWLLRQAPAESVIVFGEGLGSGPACELAATRTVAGLVLLSAFTTLPELAAARYPWLPTSWILRSRFDNLSKIGQVSAPKLIAHSRADKRVPFALGERLFEAAAEPKRALWLEGAGHNEVYSATGPQLAAALAAFVASLKVPE